MRIRIIDVRITEDALYCEPGFTVLLSNYEVTIILLPYLYIQVIP